MNYVILAGGNGSRFTADGVSTHKPLIPILGTPMIGRLIMQLSRFEACNIHIAANSRMINLIHYIDEMRLKGYPVECIPVDNDNSFQSLKEAARNLEGKFIGITCDAIFDDDEFSKYVEKFSNITDDTVLMGITSNIEDESPLYVHVNECGQIDGYRYGGQPFTGNPIISAGIYGLNSKVLEILESKGIYPDSLNDFQQILASSSEFKVIPFYFSKAFDIDNVKDLRSAEQYLKTSNSNTEY